MFRGSFSEEVTIEFGFEGCAEFHEEESENGYCWRRQPLSIKQFLFGEEEQQSNLGLEQSEDKCGQGLEARLKH